MSCLINISLFAGNLPLTVGCSDPARCCHNVRNVTIRVLNCDIETVMNKQYSLEAQTRSFSFSKLKAPSSNASTLLNKYALKSKIGTIWYANIRYLLVILKRSSFFCRQASNFSNRFVEFVGLLRIMCILDGI